MKKFLLVSSVAISFALYSFHSRHGDSAPVVAPSSLTQNSTTIQTSSPTTSSSNNMRMTATNQSMMASYKDGQYTGHAADAFYGLIQVKAIISGGKITDVQFLQYPNDRSNSVFINKQAMPLLKQEAVQTQNAQVDIISGATDTSQAFVESLATALSQAKI